MKKNKRALIFYDQKEQLSKLKGLGNSTSQKMKIPENIEMQEKYKSLEIRDIFSIEELTEEDVQFIEQFLEKTNVDIESEGNYFFIISTNQMIYLLRKIMQEYNTFLSNRKKFEAL
jgi:ribosomal protein S13